MNIYKNLIIILSFLLIISCVKQQHHVATNQDIPFNIWKEELYQEAIIQGFNKALLTQIFALIQKSPAYLAQDIKQFKKQTFSEYYLNAVNNLRIKKAKDRIKKHNKILTQIEQKYLVPKEYIISLWAIESDFGDNQGNYHVVNALANLAFNSRRKALFKKEFFASLTILSTENITPKDLKGSWAGATGQCQFLPSTYLAYAVDFNGDNKKDIWHNKDDIMASIANYLSSLKWDHNIPWGYEIKNIPNLTKLANKRKYLLKDLKAKYQIDKIDNAAFSSYELEKKVTIITYEDRFFVTFKNFDVIKIWNNSSYFALTVGLLANQIKE